VKTIRLVNAVLGFVASILAIVAFIQACSPTDTDGESADSATTSADRPAESAGSTTAVACLDDAQSPIACSLPHLFEVIPSAQLGTCSRVGIFDYLGGVSGLDVLRFEFVPTSGGCKVSAPTKVPQMFADAAKGPRSGLWRSCFSGSVDTPADRDYVDCEQPHVGEEIGTSDEAEATYESCQMAVEQYTGQPYRNLEDELGISRLIAVTKGVVGSARCEVYVKSLQPLTDTIRRLGNKVLPR